MLHPSPGAFCRGCTSKKDKKLLTKRNKENLEREELKKTFEEKDKEINNLKQNKNYFETYEKEINILKKELNTIQSELDKEAKEIEKININEKFL